MVYPDVNVNSAKHVPRPYGLPADEAEPQQTLGMEEVGTWNMHSQSSADRIHDGTRRPRRRHPTAA